MTENQLRQRVLETAAAWLGKSQTNGTHHEIIDLYNSQPELPRGYKVTYTDQWCATFVSAVMLKAGLTEIAPTECGCEQMIRKYQQLGRWVERDDFRPQPADIIFYDWQAGDTGDATGWADHVGIVWSVSGNVIRVIEGNRHHAVGWRDVVIDATPIRGFAIPDYASLAGDEDPDTWFAEACSWAKAQGLVNGDGCGNYGWDQPITLQQACALLHRAHKLR